METVGHLNIIQELQQLNDNLTLWLTEGNDGQIFEVLTIKQNKDYQTLLDRLLKNEILPLVNKEIEGIQKIIGTDFDKKTKNHYIIYQHNDNLQPVYNPTIKALKSLLTGLDSLKKQNRFGFVISDETIITNQSEAKLRFVGLYELFKQQYLLNKNFLAPELPETRPNFQSDIYSVFKCFEAILESNQDETLKEIFAKSLLEKRTSRFSKYSEILEELEKVKISGDLVQSTTNQFIRVVVKHEDIESILPIISEMNNSCSILLDKAKSDERKQITGRFSTSNFSGKFNVNNENYIFIHHRNCRNHPNSQVLKDGFNCPYGFDFHQSRLDCYSYFHNKWEELNTITELNRTKQDALNKWQTLPDQEREFIEENAFKAKYIEREESKNNPTNIRFTLTEEFRNWDKLKELKRNEVNLSIDDKIIGKIQDYNPSDCFLVIKDAKITVDEIPEKGDLLQDVRMETSQFKKQVEACKKFENKDIVNPELCGILATPERIPEPNRIDIDYDDFIKQVINENLKTDQTQREAVLEALHYKPVYLIQGPPGTGKTTVIVELIQQIISQNSNAKILVTSQSNLAVDNVLEKLPENILFMRLAVDEDRISNEIKEHSFQSKLKHWVKDTQENSTKFFNDHFQNKIKDKALVTFYNFYSNNIRTGNETAFGNFNNLLRIQNQYIKELFGNAKNFKEVEQIFNEKLGKEFQQLKTIQKDWFAFLSNADTDEGAKKKSILNDGSNEIDLQTSFVKSVNVIGATCIHIASSQYSKIHFRFDFVIMDESSKASPAENLVPINMGQNIILIGDHNQLPPVITREEAVKQKIKDKLEDNGLDIEKEFGESLFEKLITAFEANENLYSFIKMLDIQYRMPRQIGNLIGRFFYDRKLKNPDIKVLPNFDADKFHGLKFRKPTTSIFDTTTDKEIEVPNSVVFISTSNQPNPNDNDNKFNRCNQCNKNTIKEILTQLNKLYPYNLKREKPLTIGVIAGYRGQVNLLKDSIDLQLYKNFLKTDEEGKAETLIEINTVDKFQGAERDIIIYDIVKSSKGVSSIGFLDDYRRINVAFSRVKRLLIVVGDSEYILKRATLNPSGKFTKFKLKEIVEELDRQGVIVHSLNEMIQ